MVHLKREKVVLSYISSAYILLLAYPFHFIDLSAQNAINQYHFNKATVWRFHVSKYLDFLNLNSVLRFPWGIGISGIQENSTSMSKKKKVR